MDKLTLNLQKLYYNTNHSDCTSFERFVNNCKKGTTYYQYTPTAGASRNAQFMPTSTQPQKKVSTWFNPELQPQNLQKKDHAMLS